MVPVDTTLTSAAMPTIMTAQTDNPQIDAFMNESRRQQKPRTSDPNFNAEKTNLIVNYLPQNFTDQEFFNLFSTVGKCNKARIIRHRQTGYSYGYGFIDMGSSADAEKAIKKLNQYQIGHKRLKVAYSLPSGERTRNINLYIKGLPKTWTKRDLETKFRAFGDIRNARILLDPATQMGTGVGFLLYATRNEAEKACQLMNGESIEGGEPLQISFARSQSQPPVEWVLAGQPIQPMIQPTQIGQIAAFGGIVPQPSTYKGRRYNPIAGKSNLVQQQQQQPQNQRQLMQMMQNQIPQQMIMVPTFNTMPYAQQLQNQQLEAIQVVQPTQVQSSSSPQQQHHQPQQQQQAPPTSVKQTVQSVTTSQPILTSIQQTTTGTPVSQHQQLSHHQQQQQVQQTQQVQPVQQAITSQAQQMMMSQMMPANITLAQAPTQLIQPQQQYQQVASRGYYSTGVM